MIDQNKIISDFDSAVIDFFNATAEDPRVGPLHVSLFMAILHFYKKQNCIAPIPVTSKEVMKHAKISSACTYHRYIKELHTYGYIYYEPSNNPSIKSLVYPIKIRI